MKTKLISVVCMLCGIYSVVAQAEYDDMYFTSKDRANQTVALKVEKPQNSLNALTETNAAYQAVLPNSALQGYSGRTINPDYQPGAVAVVSSSYFKPNYQPTSVNKQLYSNNNNFNNCNTCYRPYSSYYGMGGYGMGGYYSPFSSFGYSPFGYNSFGYSPYSYGGYYDPYYSGMGYSPYYGYGNSMYGYGSSMAMYFGLAYGFGSPFGYGYGGYGYGGYYGSYGGYYPGTVVVVNNPDNHVNSSYGRRQTRSSYTNAGVNSSGNYAGRGAYASNVTPDQNRGGRVGSASTSNAYYQRGWRQDPSITQSSSSSSSGSRYSGYSSGTSNNTRSGWSSFGNTNSGTTRSSWGNSSNSGFSNSGFGGASRSSMSSGSSFGGGSRSSGFSGGGGSVSHSGGGGRGRGN